MSTDWYLPDRKLKLTPTGNQIPLPESKIVGLKMLEPSSLYSTVCATLRKMIAVSSAQGSLLILLFTLQQLSQSCGGFASTSTSASGGRAFAGGSRRPPRPAAAGLAALAPLRLRRHYHHHHHRNTPPPLRLLPTVITTITTNLRHCYGTTTTTTARTAAAPTSAAVTNDDDDSISRRRGGDYERQEEMDRSQLLKKRKRKLTMEFVKIGGPALIQLAAEPLAALVDTAYLGRLGPDVLGGAGVAVSAQYAVSKLYNDPLLRTSISLVAASDGGQRIDVAEGTATDAEISLRMDQQKQNLSVAVSSALLLAAVVGLVQMVVYIVFGRAITLGMGLSPSSPMWYSAVSYLQIRALGTPAATLWLVTNGIFRGLGDTQTPLVYSLAFTLLNAILDPLFIFVLHWGAAGAAAGTALAQYVALIPLLLALHAKAKIDVSGRQWQALKNSLQQYVTAGSFILVRTVGKVLAYAVCARQAALLGSIAAATYNLTFQLGFATTQICEAVAVAVQTLLARELATAAASDQNNATTKAALIRHLISTSLWLGGGVATLLALVTYGRRDWILQSLTTNAAIQAAATTIFPVVLLTQVFKGLAYPVNGIIMGGLDWSYSMLSMWLANLVCIGMVRNFALRSSTGVASLGQLWLALAAFMGTQVVASILRYESKTGVWKVLRRTSQNDRVILK